MNLPQKDTCTPMFTAALFTIAKTWKQPKCPSMDEWIKKIWYIYTMEYYSYIKKNKVISFAATWIELEILILSDVRKRKTSTIRYRLHVESKIWHKWTYLQNRNRLTDMENKLVVAKGVKGGLGGTRSFGLEWINGVPILAQWKWIWLVSMRTGSIPDLTEWVKDLALQRPVV